MSKTSNKELIKEVLKEISEQERQTNKRKVFRNTELLMKNYNVLKQHSENAVYSFTQSITDIEPLTFENLYIEAILKSKIRTTIMVQHIDMALEMLHKNSMDKGKQEENKYNAMIDNFVTGETFEELAEKYNCTPLTVRRWKNDMLRNLGILLFGVDGLLSQLNIS